MIRTFKLVLTTSREFEVEVRIRSGLVSELGLEGLDGVVEVWVRSSGEFWEGGACPSACSCTCRCV